MTWKSKASAGASTEVPPPGAHAAICVGLVDMGHHMEIFEDKDKDGKPTGKKKEEKIHKVFFAWELTSLNLSGTKDLNHVVGRDFNWPEKMGPKSALRQMLEKVRGRKYEEDEDIDISRFIGVKCLITITHGTSQKGKLYGKLDGIGPLPSGMPVLPAKHQPYMFSLDDGDFNPPSWFPGWSYGEKLTDIVANCIERKGTRPPATNNAGTNGTHQENGAMEHQTADACPF